MGITEGWNVAEPGKEVSTPEDVAAVEGRMQGRRGDSRLVLGIDTDSVMGQCTAATYAKHVHGVIPLRTFFYKLKRYMPLDVDVVCVFDGSDRPSMKNGRKVHKMTEPSWHGSCQILIKKLGYHVHKAPGEGEAELAALNERGFIDFVLTSDSDVFPFGAKNVLRSTRAKRDEISLYRSDRIEVHQELNKAGLILYSLLAGGDYTKGVLGCGQKTALALAQCGFGDTLYAACTRYEKSPDLLQCFISSWLQSLRDELRTNSKNRMNEKQPALAARLTEKTFPSADIVLLYACPLTSFSAGKKPDFRNRWKARPIDIAGLASFFMEHFGWRTIQQLQNAFDRNVWEGMFRQLLYSDESYYDADGHVLITNDHWIQLVGVEEKSRRTQRRSLIDMWYRVRVSTQPLIEALNEAHKGLKDEDGSDNGQDHDDAAFLTPAAEMLIWVPATQCPDALVPFSHTSNSNKHTTLNPSPPARSNLLTRLDVEMTKMKTRTRYRSKKTAAAARTPAPFPCPSPLEGNSGSECAAGPSTFPGSYKIPTTSEPQQQPQQKRRRLTDDTTRTVIDLTEDD